MELISPTELAKEKVEAVQDYAVLAGRSVFNLFRHPRYFGDIVQQADLIGVGSLPIVILAGLSIGAELALNSAATLEKFGSLSLIGQLVSVGMVTELGPIITGLMVAGRNASGIASELGSMVVTEQIDAMRALGTDPMKKLVAPRVVSTVFMLFFLTIIADLLGLIGGGIIARLIFGIDSRQYWNSAWQALAFRDVFTGLIETPVFRFHHRDRRLLLRDVDSRGHTGRGQGDYAGDGRVLGADFDSEFLHHQTNDGDSRTSLSHGRASQPSCATDRLPSKACLTGDRIRKCFTRL